MTKIVHWPRYASHNEAKCFMCDGALEGYPRKTWYDGNGAWEQRCARCSLTTWYDVDNSALPGDITPKLPWRDAPAMLNQLSRDLQQMIAADQAEGNEAIDVRVTMRVEGPYPSCRTPEICNKHGYCRRDPACNE